MLATEKLDSYFATGSVDWPNVLMEGVRGQHEHTSQQPEQR